jgi:hypothetical protein
VSLSRSLPALAAGLGAVLLSACGSGGSGGAATTPRPAGEAARTATQLLADTQAALAAASSFRMRFSATSSTDGAEAFDLVISTAGVKGTITSGDATAQVIVVGGDSYVQGRAFFAKVAGAAAAAAIGDRWVKMPAGQSLGFDQFKDPKTTATCLLAPHGTLVKGGTSTFQGEPTVQLLDKGDIPGDAPGTVEIATSGPAYPLHLAQTGAQTPGHSPTPAVCGPQSSGSGGTTTNAQATLSDFGATVTITAPPDPIEIPSNTT